MQSGPRAGQGEDMIISPGRRYIFIHIPKTGGTSMALALEDRAQADDILIGNTPKAVRRRQRVKKLKAPGRLWKHSRLKDIDGMEGLPVDPFIFTMVRNPWDRMVSLYYWSRAQTFNHPMIQAAIDMEFKDFIFTSIIKMACKRDATALYVTDAKGQLRCDAFIRLEHLETDLAPVEAHLGFRLSLPKANASEHPITAEVYTKDMRQRVADLFAADIARFGYTFPEGGRTG